MKKYFYTVCCFLAATAFALTSCGDDETIIDEPDVPVTPENPDEEETSYSVGFFDLNVDTEILKVEGDSVAFFALTDELVKEVQDSLTNAESTMRIEMNDADHSFALIAEKGNEEEFRNVELSLIRRLVELGNEPRNFVYTGSCIEYDYTVKSVGNIFAGAGSLGSSTGEATYCIYIPNISSTSWTTEAEGASVQTITFEGKVEATDAHINGNQDVLYRVKQQGAQVSLTATDDTYVFNFNETGTELTLVSINGEAVSETYVYTMETPAE